MPEAPTYEEIETVLRARADQAEADHRWQDEAIFTVAADAIRRLTTE